MHFREAITTALDTLWAHKLRSFLTLLGVIISVWTLVAVVSLVTGMNQYVGDKIANLGSNTFELDQLGLITDYEEFLKAKQHNRVIRRADFEYLRERAQLPVAIAATVQRQGQVKAGTQSMDQVQIEGVTPDHVDMQSYTVASGRFLTATDEMHHSYTAFVGPDIAKNLFPGLDPVGKTIEVDGREFEIVGVASVQGNTFGMSQDNFVNIPLSTYQKIYGTQDSLGIEFQAASTALIPATMDEVRMLMRNRHHLGYYDKDDFGLVGADAIMDLWHRITGTIAAVMIGVSVVFLVVGGIVIMNIMLAAVTDRTREIGVRKAIGARRRDILNQFLIESAVLSGSGGIIGIALAWIFTLIAAWFTPVPFKMPLGAVIVALLVSTGVGLFFGIYPASKAARLDPIVALRAEV
jgi:putative ABC transport system permease protein